MENITNKEVYVFPLSVTQKRLWVLSQFEGVNAAYNMPAHLHIQGRFNVGVFKRTVEHVIGRHDSLRTYFDQVDGEVVQIVMPELTPDIAFTDIRHLPEAEREIKIKEAAMEESKLEFDLKRGPLFRMQLFQSGPEDFHLLFTMHHIISDGWSIGVFISETSQVYNAFMEGQSSPLPELDIQYGDYTVWQQEWLSGDRVEKQLSYWRKRLKDAPSLLEFPSDRIRPAIQSFNGNTLEFSIDSHLTAKLKLLSKQEHTTLFITLLSAFATLLSKFSRENDIVIGTPNTNRSRTELEGLIGFFVSTLLLRTDLSGDPTFVELLHRNKRLAIEAYENQDISFEKILEEINPKRSLSYNPLFQVMFSLENMNQGNIAWNGIKTRFIKPPLTTSKFDLTLAIEEHANELTGKLEYNTDIFDRDTIHRLSGYYVNLLQAILANPIEKISKLSLLSASEEIKLLQELHSPAFEYPGDKCIHQLFEAVAAQYPAKTAIIFNETARTYSELHTITNQLARYLQKRGVTKGTLVGISMERSMDMVIAVLAILKAGAAYIPLDPTYPKERIAFIIKDAGIKVLLTHDLTHQLFEGIEEVNFALEREAIMKEGTTDISTDPSVHSVSSDLAYVIYTSGTTGLPKGVAVRHQSVVNFLFSMRVLPGMTGQDTMLAVTSLSFDIAGLEIFLPLLCGGSVVIADRSIVSDGTGLGDAIEKHNITIMQATPSTWKLMLDAGWQGQKRLKILCGGEAFPRELAAKLLTRSAEVWNMYGPTETTIWSTIWKVQPGGGSVLIGRPIANTSILLLDDHLKPVPAGVPAELYIGGDGVAAGYLNRPDLTDQRFVDNPFLPGSRLYRTGDMARLLKNGNIEFIGRADYQVKLNGHRIEPGEIETLLNLHPQIKESIVVIKEDGVSGKRLVAYLTTEEEPHPTINDLRDHLVRKLPAYMIPSIFVFLEQFPLTPNGKIDRKALPSPDNNRPELLETYVAPDSQEEKILAEIWGQVLGIENIGIHDNFFSLGGASLQSVAVASKASEAGLLVTPELVFEYQTISSLAKVVEKVVGIHTAYHVEDDPFKLTADSLYNVTDNSEKQSTIETENIIIESMGTYLPAAEVSSKDIVAACAAELRFPLERLTGIKTRRMVTEGEYAPGLAIKAIEKCLAMSKYHAEDIDMFLCCNVFRYDGERKISFEPSTAMTLKKHFGFNKAMVFDVSNACTGVFTAINIAESFIRSGAVKNVLIASGEYLTHLTRTSQLEVESYMDTRIAGLTVGDSGLALIVERSPSKDLGFQELEMFTMGEYSPLCVVKATGKDHGGLVLNTDAIRMAEAGHLTSSKHAFKILKKGKWTPDSVKHLILHQASSTTLKNTMRSINKLFGKQISTEANTIDNIAHRGNTATTTHFMAIADNIDNNKIQSGDRVVFCISGSGLNLGTALYVFDDLPQRLRQQRDRPEPGDSKLRLPKSPLGKPFRMIQPTKRIKLGSIGTTAIEFAPNRDGIAMLKMASENCLAATAYTPGDIGLLIYSGVYRDDLVLEPAIAALLAGEIKANASNDLVEDRLTFAFDIFNGSIGCLNACSVATQMLQAGKSAVALVVAGEIENNPELDKHRQLGVSEKASALLLCSDQSDSAGFVSFFFKDYPDQYDALRTYATWGDGNTFIHIDRAANLEDQYISCIKEMVMTMVAEGLLDMSEIKAVFPPQISSGFISGLGAALGWSKDMLVNVVDGEKDLYTSSMAFSLQHAMETGKVKKGERVLIIAVGSGIQTGCAIYQI